jgi:hypothetical protein
MSKLLAIVQRMSRSYSEDGYNAGIAIKYKRGEFGIYLTQLENRIRQYYVIQLVTLIVFTIGSQLLTSSHRVCP